MLVYLGNCWLILEGPCSLQLTYRIWLVPTHRSTAFCLNIGVSIMAQLHCSASLLWVLFMEVILIWNGNMAGSVTVPAPVNPGTLHPGSWHYLGWGLSISYSLCNLSRRNPPMFSTTTTTHLHNHYGVPLPLPLPSTATAITTTELEMHISSLRRFFFLFCGQAK